MSFEKKSKILITGASGLVGSHLLNHLYANDYNNLGILQRTEKKLSQSSIQINIGDVNDIISLEDAFEGVGLVIHCAALVSFDPRDKQQLFKTNEEGTANIVNACLKKGVEKLILISSVAALGKPEKIVDSSKEISINEDQKWLDSPLNSNYAKSKWRAECEVRRGEAEGLKVMILNPSVILGEGDITKSSSRLFEYVKNGNRFTTGGYLNYVDLEDLVNITEQLIKKDIWGQRFIINAGRLKFKDFFKLVATKMNVKPPSTELSLFWINILWKVEYLRSLIFRSRPLITKETAISASSNFYFDSTKIKKELGFVFRPLEQTIERLAIYYSKR